jgi:hypothetical protein
VLARGLGLRAALGSAGIRDDRLAVRLDADLDPDHPLVRSQGEIPGIDPDWLAWVPEKDAVAVVSVALGRGGAYWDGVFDLADRVDRVDPARAELAPLRTRVNLLATAAGARLEADLWPHLRGLTLCLLVDPRDPARPGRAVLGLHADGTAAARQIAEEVIPRLAGLPGRLKRRDQAHQPAPAKARDPSAPRPLGRVAGRPLEVALRGPTVLIGWGDGALGAILQASDPPGGSVIKVMTADWDGSARNRPHRAGAFWPGRMRVPVRGLDGPTPLVRSLAQGPPVVWLGWTARDRACDRVCWPELRPLVKRFLDAVPLDPRPVP